MAKKVQKKKVDENIKRFSLTKEEQQKIDRLLITKDVFEISLRGIQYSISVEEAFIQQRVKMIQPPAGFRYNARLDIQKGELVVEKVKIPESNAN